MNPSVEKPPEIGDLVYTFLDPDDKWGLLLASDPVVVIVMEVKESPFVYTTFKCLTISGIVQTLQYLDIHYTKEEAYLWYEKFYGKTTLKDFRGQ